MPLPSEKNVAQLRILWFALFASTLTFLVVMFVATPQRSEPPPMTLALPLSLVGVMVAATSAVFPAAQYRTMLRSKQFEMSPDMTGDDPGSYRQAAPFRNVFSNPDMVLRGVLPAFQTTTILGMALAEAVALLGFVLGFLGLPKAIAIPFFCVCWVLQLTKFPTLQKIVGPVEKLHNARFRV